ncbi:MAG: Gfo/Idh/MocA family oxidoreductase [Lentisphaeria bacterium]|jgi:predicted dehydrogenase|nr:Gfo/Idh/MocA family oxidoreductase [Lentisphaeria bacterium]MDP7741339.1 Gfo/Idh/MocA family oxidoreductase [Lentisphaeria bacterium]
MSNTTRWGILSTAWINVALVGPLQRSPRSELLAVASRSGERARAFAKQNSIPRAYDDYGLLLADPDIEVIYNPLPNTMHSEWIVKAAAAGKHVLCEKPLTTTIEAFDAIEAAAAKAGVTVVEAISFLHHPQIAKIQELIRAGRLGELQLINCWDAFHLAPEDRDNIRYRRDLGGGALWDVGVYPNSFAIAVAGAGPPVQVWACQSRNGTDVDLATTGQMRFANGVTAQIACGMRSPERRGAQIIGSAGMLEVMDHLSGGEWPGEPPREGRLTYTGRDGREEVIPIPAVNAFQCEVEAMEACVLDGAEPVVSLRQSREFLQSLLALHRSAETGTVVSL